MKKILFTIFAITSVASFAQVGIGTPTPNGALDITSGKNGVLLPRVALSNTTTAAPIVNPTGGALVTGTMVFNTATAGDVVPGYYYWNGSIWVPVGTNPNLPANFTANNGLTKTGNNVALGGTLSASTTIAQAGFNLNTTGTGNVGIGTAAPTNKLEVSGGAIALDNAQPIRAKNSGGTFENLLFRFSDNITYLEGGSSGTVFRTANATINNIFLNPNGNTGLGSVPFVPNYRLTLQASSLPAFVAGTRPFGGIGLGVTGTALTGMLGWVRRADGNPTFLIQAVEDGITWRDISLVRDGGNVGIGTDAPEHKLAVVGNIGLNNQGAIFGKNTLGATEAAFYPRATDNRAYLYGGTAGTVLGSNNGLVVNQFLSQNGGTMIGSFTEPTARLSVFAGSIAAAANSELELANFGGYTNNGGGNNPRVGFSLYKIAAAPDWPSTAILLNYDVDATKRAGGYLSMYNGNIGIGTANPVAALDINTKSANGDGILFNSAADNQASIQTYIDGQKTNIAGYVADPNYILSLQPIKGYVGIGTTTPVAKFQVQTNDAQVAVFGSPNGSRYLTLGNGTSNNGAYFQRIEAVGWRLGIHTGGFLSMADNGNLGVNGQLAVSGPIQTINAITPTNGAIRLTPNLHFNSGPGSSIYTNWDSGAGVGTNPTFVAANGASGELFRVNYNGSVTSVGSITAPGFFQSSDLRLKDISKRDGDVAYYTWKDGRDKKVHTGYIAQEVQIKNPDQVNTDKAGMMSVNYIEILVEKVRKLEKMEAKVIELEKEIKLLKAKK